MTRSATRVEGLGLKALDLRCSFGRRTVVDHVSIEVAPGEIVGLLGPNGAGKTTLFNLLMGLLPTEAGSMSLHPQDGQPAIDITWLPPHRRALLGLGYLPQGPSVFSGLSVRDNLRAVLQLRGLPEARADELLEAFDLSPRAGQRARSLSGGERRRLELARLMAGEPRVLLLDEPLQGLDPLAVDQLCGLLLRLRGESGQKRIAILLTDHNVVQALTICSRAYILVDGRVMAAGSPAEVTAHPGARERFWGPAASLMGPP